MSEPDSDVDTLPGSKYDKYGFTDSDTEVPSSDDDESTEYETDTDSEAESESEFMEATRETIEAILRSILAKGNGPEYDALIAALTSPGQNDCGLKE